ncbi:hypothetical protein TIFTF001_041502 [Ficus carica]|uniref:Uncharacterized protein n=1 Tax=Ficus carica TaxID=3494 RepID=A0AA87Z706_FICCA|nr:hypothetical protein TIFTF001_041502 [Ficus carica]
MELELEQTIKRHQSRAHTSRTSNNKTSSKTSKSASQTSYGLCNRSDSFRSLEFDVSKSKSPAVRLSWLRSQLIGGQVEYDSLFGKRILTYADHTVSGRSLLYIENFIIHIVLPFYGIFDLLSWITCLINCLSIM